MAIEYANILRSLNAMQESRARREQADVDSALKGLQLAQQDKQFEQELAFKEKQEMRARDQFEIEQQKFFMNQASTLAEQNKVLMDSESEMVWNTVFRPFHDNYMKEFDGDSKKIVYKGKKTHNNLIKALESEYNMTKKQATSLASMMGTVKIAGGKNTGVMDALMNAWTSYTGTELGDAKAYKEYKGRYEQLINELDQIQEGDYEFERSKYTGEVAPDEIIGDEGIALPDEVDESVVQVLDGMSANELSSFIQNNNLSVEDVLTGDIGQKYNMTKYRAQLQTLDSIDKNAPITPQEMNNFFKTNLNIRQEELSKSMSALGIIQEEHKYRTSLSNNFVPTQEQIAAGGVDVYPLQEQQDNEIKTLLLNMQIGMLKQEIEVNRQNSSGAAQDAIADIESRNPGMMGGF